MDAPSGGALEQAPRWDLVDTEYYGSGIRVLAPSLVVWGCVGIYRRKEYVGGATGGSRGWRARPPISWASRAATDLLLPPIYTYVPRKHPGAPQITISTTVTFCIHKIPSWSPCRHSAGGETTMEGLYINILAPPMSCE